MTQRYVIDRKYLPNRPPIILGVVLWLLLDRLHAVGWVHGVCWTIYGIVFVGLVLVMFQEKDVHPSEVPKR